MGRARGQAPRSVRSSRRRQELLDAARRVFEERGYFGTRVADIVQRLNVSHGTFYSYFASKDDVLRVLVDEMSNALFEVSTRPVGHHDTPFLALQSTIHQFVYAYRDWAGLMRTLEQALALDDEFLAVRQQLRDRFSERLESVIRRHQSRVPDPENLNPRLAAYALGGMVDDFVHGVYVLAHSIPDEDAIATLSIIWARAIGLPIERQGDSARASRPDGRLPRRALPQSAKQARRRDG